MTDENSHDKVTEEDQLVLVYSPGLWPYRSPLDRASWLLGRGLSEALTGLPGLVGYLSPNALVDPAAIDYPGEVPFRVYRTLPPIGVVRREAAELGARWAITGRLLTDREGMELWLNCLDGPSGDLLWTGRVQPKPTRLLWTTAGLLRRMLKDLQVPSYETITVNSLFPTSDWQTFILLARLDGQIETWSEEDIEKGIEIVATASRALALDPKVVQAGEVLRIVVEKIVANATNKPELERTRDAMVGDSASASLREMRQLVHKRWLTLAQATNQT